MTTTYKGLRHWLALLAIGSTLLLVGQALANLSGPAVNWWVVAGGGGSASGSNVTLNATLGQPIVGTSAGSDITLGAGYWYGTTPDYHIYLPLVVRDASAQ